MDFCRSAHWFAIQAKPLRENLAAASVAKLGVEAFLPKTEQQQFVCSTWRLVVKALFPGYLFARFCPHLAFDAVRFARGVVRVVGSADAPVPIPAEVIEEIRGREADDGLIRLELDALRPGDRLRINQGPFEGLMGSVEREWDGNRRVAILLEALSNVRVLVERRWLEPANAA